jgi:hypothetical protein
VAEKIDAPAIVPIAVRKRQSPPPGDS